MRSGSLRATRFLEAQATLSDPSNPAKRSALQGKAGFAENLRP